jgi:hypothetical protein
MNRRLGIAFCLCLSLVAVRCTADPDVPSQAGGGDVATRTLASMLPYIKKSLTPVLAEQTFGAPDGKTGAGPINYVYVIEDQKKVNLTFPSATGTITFASVQDRNGVSTPITIAD